MSEGHISYIIFVGSVIKEGGGGKAVPLRKNQL